MSEARLNRAIDAIRKSGVEPQLINETHLLSLEAPRKKYYWLATIGLIVGLVGAVGWQYSNRTDKTVRSQLETMAAVENHEATVSNNEPSGEDDKMVGNKLIQNLDPNSILVLSLTPEELLKFGVRSFPDSVIATHQSLVAQSPAMVKALGVDSIKMADSLSLFTFETTSTREGTLGMSAVRFDARKIYPHASIFALVFDSAWIPRPLTWIFPALINGRELERITDNEEIVPLISNLVTPERAWSSILTSEFVFPRDAKPILVYVPIPATKAHTFLYFLPTREVLGALPRRFASDVNVCYDVYQPPTPRLHLPAVVADAYAVKLKQVGLKSQSSNAGYIELALTKEELLEIGIAFDSASIYTSAGSGFTTDSLLVRKAGVGFSQLGADSSFLTYIIGNRRSSTWIDGVDMFADSLQAFPKPTALSIEVQTDPVSPAWKCISGETSHRITTDKDMWKGNHPRTMELASRVSYALAFRNQEIDSLAVMEFEENGITLPVDRLLIPIRIETPWISRAHWGTMRKRIVAIAWFLPTPELFDRLPNRIREFIQPEYNATLDFVEKQLSGNELCALLNSPSAFGLCSVGDTILRVESVGPIPAREAMTITVYSSTATSATVRLVSTRGVTVLERQNISLQEGSNQVLITLTGENIPQGAYSVVLTCPQGTRTSRVLISAD